ncbi:MAG: insulinase family protein [Proteobacteria bacterium]|nr:insulinase family protein [Pseudomonadota bacterium]
MLTVARRPSESFTLANGLQIVVLPSHRAPIVTQVVLYKVGGADETFGQTGVAHFLEHMMFKGTATVGPNEFSRIVSRSGGRDNAYTDFDVTAYHQTVAADRLEMVMRMESDRMVNLRLAESDLRTERQVVLEERRMRTDNVPSMLLDEASREQLFGRHRPYGMPVVGYVDDVKRLTVGDLGAFYRRHYAPNNAVLIVAGDTTPEAVRKLAERHYGPLARRTVPPRSRPSDGGKDLPQRVVRADARVVETRWERDYLAPSYRLGATEHACALSVLARLLGGSETSRLWRALVSEARVALSASASYGGASLGLSSFGFDVQPARGTGVAAIEAAVGDQMKKLLDDGVTEEEVERAQNRMLAQTIYSQDSLASGPRLYAAVLSTGGTVAEIDDWPKNVAAVTPAAVLAAARHVWRDDNAVTSLLTPVGSAQ